MDPGLFLKGIAIGFSIAAAVGPISILVMRRTLAQGLKEGLASGLGVATADAIYGAVAGFSLTLVSSFLLNGQFWLRLIGGIFLCYLGIKTALSKPSVQAAASGGRGLFGLYFSTLLLTLTNPLTILSFAAILAGLNSDSRAGSYFAAATLVAGVFSGSAFWWLILTTVITFFRERFTPTALKWVNRISGTVILSFGGVALWSLILAS